MVVQKRSKKANGNLAFVDTMIGMCDPYVKGQGHKHVTYKSHAVRIEASLVFDEINDDYMAEFTLLDHEGWVIAEVERYYFAPIMAIDHVVSVGEYSVSRGIGFSWSVIEDPHGPEIYKAHSKNPNLSMKASIRDEPVGDFYILDVIAPDVFEYACLSLPFYTREEAEEAIKRMQP